MYGRTYMGVERTTVLIAPAGKIAPDGKIARIWRKVKVPGHAEAVLEAVRMVDIWLYSTRFLLLWPAALLKNPKSAAAQAPPTSNVPPPPNHTETLAGRARAIVVQPDVRAKIMLAKAAAKDWHHRRLSLARLADREPMPEQPGRPDRPQLLAPREMPRRRSGGRKGRIALLHALAHIELSAIDMTWDLVGRFAFEPMPRSFFDDWVRVGVEEAKHFELLMDRLEALGSEYGALPAHDGLWQALQATGDDLMARLAIVPLVLEARGLDVSPAMVAKLRDHGDEASARILDIIYNDEKHHVAFGLKWFRFLCRRHDLLPEPTFHRLVRQNFRGALKPPFNDKARSEAGLTPGFYKPLAAFGP